jgi:hypothetical protein
MQICDAMKLLRIAAVPVISIVIGLPAFVCGQAPAKPATAPAAPPTLPPVQLQPYTAPDQSMSVGVPSGWKVKVAGVGSATLTGPGGEAIIAGRVYVALDSPFQLGQRGPNGADMTMPSSALLSDKLTMVLAQVAALNGQQPGQFKFVYGKPLQMPPGVGQCGLFAIAGTVLLSDSSGNAATGPGDAMGLFCSLPDDSGQFFKNFLMYGSAPTATAKQTVPAVAAVFKSYRLGPGWAQRLVAPFTAPASPAMGPAYGPDGPDAVAAYSEIIADNQRAIDIGADCSIANLAGPSSWNQAAECGYLSPF